MKYVRLELVLQSPTSIAQRPTAPGQMTETPAYLPGTAVRGGLASAWLAGGRPSDMNLDEWERFADLFISGAVRFGNGWISSRDGQTWIVPATAWTRKPDGGWKGEAKSGVRDVLTTLLKLDSAVADIDLDRLMQTLAGWDRLGQGFALNQGGRWGSLDVRRRLISRTALTPITRDLPSAVREVAAEGQLYSFEALETGQRFTTELRGPDDLVLELTHLAQRRDAMLSIGQGRSRGLGQVAVVRATVIQDPPSRPSVEQLAAQAQAFSQRAGSLDDRVYLPVTLESDTILRDQYLLPCSSGDPHETLVRYLRACPPTMELHTAVQSTRWLSGWDELRRLPRPPQLAVRQGSVWVYRVPGADLYAAIRWWLEAEAQGLGERRSEGFGQVRLLHPFHAEEREEW